MPKTPDEIKKGLGEEIPVHYHIDGEPRLTPRLLMDMQWLHKDAIALIQQLEAKVPRWISVEERLPEDEKDVAVIVKLQKGNWMYLTAFRLPCGGWWINRGAGLDYAEVTHWMPLPEPPKEESPC